MVIVYSVNKVPIRFTEERWRHVTLFHPEVKSQKTRIEDTVAKPEIILEGDQGAFIAIRRYGDTPVTKNKYLTVIYKEVSREDGFIITAYFSNAVSTSREVLWNRSKS